MDAFVGLAPPSSVRVRPALLFPSSNINNNGKKTKNSKGRGKNNKNKKGPNSGKGGGGQPPMVRCVSLTGTRNSMDVANVDSVDKVYRILTKHMNVQDVSAETCECLKFKYKGNGYLDAGKEDLAIAAYDKALAIVPGVPQQEGILLLMRATAYLQRARAHKEELREIVNEVIGALPDDDDEGSENTAGRTTTQSPALANAVFRRVLKDTITQEKTFRRTQYRHGLYQYALLKAAQDSLRATELLPKYPTSWLRAGEILSELWKLKESAQYYERALELDDEGSSSPEEEEEEDGPSSTSLKAEIDRLRKRQQLLDDARAYGWEESTLRLALDVAG